MLYHLLILGNAFSDALNRKSERQSYLGPSPFIGLVLIISCYVYLNVTEFIINNVNLNRQLIFLQSLTAIIEYEKYFD